MSIEQCIQQLLEKQRPEISALTQSLRAFIKSARPELTEDCSVKLGNIYFKHHGVVCALTPHKSHVNLHFYKGAQLSDPDGVLEGKGKALRHLKFQTPNDVNEPIITRLINEAFKLTSSIKP